MGLLEAKTWLNQTRMGIREIADKIGKQDPSDFSRFFNHYTGFIPMAFRQTPNRVGSRG